MKILLLIVSASFILKNVENSNNYSVHAFSRLVNVSWTNCPVFSDGTISANNVYAECTFIEVPLHWESSQNSTDHHQTLDIFVKRYFIPGTTNSAHQLWRIPGGGGIPISSLEIEAVAVVSALFGAVSIYATDKRGVGKSSFLECPTSIIQNFSACLPFIRQNRERLLANTFTNTARDLKYVVRMMNQYRKPNDTRRVFLMGSSQGTYLLQRYFHLMEEDEPVNGIILDAVLPTDKIRLINTDPYMNYMFLDLFGRCAQDAHGCAKHFEKSNPFRALYNYKIHSDLSWNSTCLGLLNVTNEELGKKMSYIFYPGTMQILPALIFRINRCNENDRKALKMFINRTMPPQQDGQPGFSILVELNNNLAELWDTRKSQYSHVPCELIKGMSQNTFLANHVMPDIFCPIESEAILGYPTDEFYQKYPQKPSTVPVLVLHGDMDNAIPVPLSRHFYVEYSKVNPNVMYLELPRSGHTATNASPMENEETNCGWMIAASFILSPSLKPDVSCLDNISQIDFEGKSKKTQESSLFYFGTEDLWQTEQIMSSNSTKTTLTSTTSSADDKRHFTPSIVKLFFFELLILCKI